MQEYEHISLCKVCGNKPELMISFFGFHIECRHCCTMGPIPPAMSKKEAIAEWNSSCSAPPDEK